MKKIKNIGKVLTSEEQKAIKGGDGCMQFTYCNGGYCVPVMGACVCVGPNVPPGTGGCN